MSSFKWLSHDEFKGLTSAKQLEYIKELVAFLKEEERQARPSRDEPSPTPDGPPRGE